MTDIYHNIDIEDQGHHAKGQLRTTNCKNIIFVENKLFMKDVWSKIICIINLLITLKILII